MGPLWARVCTAKKKNNVAAMWRPNGRRTARSGLRKNAEVKCKYQLRCRSKKAVCCDVRPQKASSTPCLQVFCWPVKPAVTRRNGFVFYSVLTGNGRFLAGVLTELFLPKWETFGVAQEKKNAPVGWASRDTDWCATWAALGSEL